MRSKSIYKGLCLFYSIIIWNCSLFSQCLSSPKAWMDSISIIETQSIYPIHDKLNQLLDLEKSYIKCKEAKDSIYARIVHRLGDYYSKEGDLDTGISYTKEAIRINRSGNTGAQRSFLCNSFFNLGYYYNQLNDVKTSIAYYDSCVQISKYYPYKNSIALEAFEKMSFLFFFLGDYEKSIDVAEQGVLFSKQIPVSLKAALILQMAQSQIALNQKEKAEKNIKKALDMMPASDAGLPTGYFIYASFFKKIKSFKASIKYYTKAFELNKQSGDLMACTSCLINLGFCYDELNNPEKAIEYYEKAIQIQKTGNQYTLANIYNNMGSVYWKQKDFFKALIYFQKGLHSSLLHFKDSAFESNPTISMLESSSNDYYTYTLLANKGDALLQLYKKEKNKKYLGYALKAFKISDQLVDRMRRSQFGNQSKLFWREKTKKMYEHAIETCYLSDDTQSAFFFFEKSRAVLLNDKLNELGAKKYLTRQDQEKEELLNLKLFSLQQKLTHEAENSTAYNDLKQQRLIVQDSLEKFIRNMEQTNPIYYQYKYDTTVFTIQAVRSKFLKEDQSLIEYFNGDSSMYALVITPHKTILKQINFKEYTNDLNLLLQHCSNRSLLNQDYSAYSKLANKIYTYLFKPLSISTKRVIISPDGDFMPFDLLLKDPVNPASFLLNDFAFSYTYSASFLIKNQNKNLQSEHIFLGIAPVNFQPDLKQQALINSEHSLNTIEPYFSSPTLLTNENATKKQFLNNLSSHAIVQLYTHADADNTGKEPLIYFSDSSLKVSELQFLRNNISTQLIVLSACKTAVGKDMKGEGVFSFAREFAVAGIPSMIATLWSVDDQPTYQLTELFHKYLSEEFPADIALQKAKIEFLDRNDAAKQLPYFWAAHILIGETNSIDKATFSKTLNNYTIPTVSLALLLALGIGLKLRKKKII